MTHLSSKRSCFPPRAHCVGTDVSNSPITGWAYASRNLHIESGAPKWYEFTRTVFSKLRCERQVHSAALCWCWTVQADTSMHHFCKTATRSVIWRRRVRSAAAIMRGGGAFEPTCCKHVNLSMFNHRRWSRRKQQHLCLPWATCLHQTGPTKDSLEH